MFHVTKTAAFCAAALSTFIAMGLTPAEAFEGPFQGLNGTWRGSGLITLNDGRQERLRCRVTYQTSDAASSLEQNLVCASDSYTFNVVSNAMAERNTISGEWTETSRGVNGHISGRVGPRQISAHVDGAGFTASIAIDTDGRKQSVTIRPTGTDIVDVSVSLSKL